MGIHRVGRSPLGAAYRSPLGVLTVPTGGPATLWKIDPSDGSIIWKRDRGADSRAIDVRTSGGDVLIYETGFKRESDNGFVDRLTDGATPSLDWTYTGTSTTEFPDVKYSAGDGTIWCVGVTIDDSDGSEIDVASTSSGGMFRLYDGPSGTMNVNNPGGPGTIAQFSDPSTLDITTTVHGLSVPIDGDSAGNGFLVVTTQLIFEAVELLDTGHSSTDSVVLDELPRPIQCSSSSAWVWTFNTGKVYSLDATDLSTTNWSKSFAPVPYFGNSLLGIPAGYDSSDNLYLIHNSTPDAAVRLAASDGSTDWSNTDVTLAILQKVLVDSTFMYVCGLGTVSGETVQVWAYDISNGSLDWSTTLGTELARDMVLHGGSLYVCGDRM